MAHNARGRVWSFFQLEDAMGAYNHLYRELGDLGVATLKDDSRHNDSSQRSAAVGQIRWQPSNATAVERQELNHLPTLSSPRAEWAQAIESFGTVRHGAWLRYGDPLTDDELSFAIENYQVAILQPKETDRGHLKSARPDIRGSLQGSAPPGGGPPTRSGCGWPMPGAGWRGSAPSTGRPGSTSGYPSETVPDKPQPRAGPPRCPVAAARPRAARLPRRCAGAVLGVRPCGSPAGRAAGPVR